MDYNTIENNYVDISSNVSVLFVEILPNDRWSYLLHKERTINEVGFS